MKNVFINCSPKEFYEELKPLLLTLEGYTMHEDEWNKGDEGCRVNSEGDWFPHTWQIHDNEIDLADFIAAVKPKQTVDLRGKFIPCTEEQHQEVYGLLSKLGCLPWINQSAAKHCGARCKGVQVYPTNYYLTNGHQGGYPTLTLEELREIAKTVKP
jgi:hypothetical protein